MAHQHGYSADPKAAGARTAAATTKTWNVLNFPTPGDAVNYINLSPAQQAGEAFASNRSDGTVDMYFFL